MVERVLSYSKGNFSGATVDGKKACTSGKVVHPIIYKVLCIPGSCLGFLNHMLNFGVKRGGIRIHQASLIDTSWSNVIISGHCHIVAHDERVAPETIPTTEVVKKSTVQWGDYKLHKQNTGSITNCIYAYMNG